VLERLFGHAATVRGRISRRLHLHPFARLLHTPDAKVGGDVRRPGTAAQSTEADEELKDSALRIPLDQFIGVVSKRAVTIVDVRGNDGFKTAHIPGAIPIHLGSIESSD
jgi:hypothetical protein